MNARARFKALTLARTSAGVSHTGESSATSTTPETSGRPFSFAPAAAPTEAAPAAAAPAPPAFVAFARVAFSWWMMPSFPSSLSTWKKYAAARYVPFCVAAHGSLYFPVMNCVNDPALTLRTRWSEDAVTSYSSRNLRILPRSDPGLGAFHEYEYVSSNHSS